MRYIWQGEFECENSRSLCKVQEHFIAHLTDSVATYPWILFSQAWCQGLCPWISYLVSEHLLERNTLNTPKE